MGTTIAAMRLIGDNEFEIAWVGDSRVYLWDGALKQISQDHSYVQELIDQGAITSEQARTHPHRNVVTQALGVTDPQSLRVEQVRGEFGPACRSCYAAMVSLKKSAMPRSPRSWAAVSCLPQNAWIN